MFDYVLTLISSRGAFSPAIPTYGHIITYISGPGSTLLTTGTMNIETHVKGISGLHGLSICITVKIGLP